jgi:phage baseplate assembly protein V
MGFVADVAKATRPLAARVGAMVKRAILERIDDSQGTQLVQVSLLGDEVQDRCEHLQPYGVSFHPPRGSEGVAVAVQGDGSHRLVLGAASRQHRPTGVEEGEGGLYYLGEWKVFLDAQGHVHLGAKEGAAKMARADRVEAELAKIRDALNDVSGGAAGGLDFTGGNTYLVVGDVGADTVHGT